MARHGDETEEFPQGSWDAMRKAELFGITIGEQWGGAGLGDIEAAIVLEELARADVSSAILAQLIFNGPPRAIEHLGNDAMKDRWLPIAASGDGLFCIGISETEAGSSVGHMRARLTPDGDGFRLNAYKNYVTGGHKARVLPRVVPLPRAASAPRASARSSSTSKRRGVTVAGTHVKMGLRGTSEAELAFDDVRIEPDDVLLWGDPANSESFKTLISHINHERCGNAAMCIGAAQGALEYAVGYMNERKVGDKTLADLQGLQWKIADMATQLEGARLLLQRAVHMAGPARHAARARDRDGEDRGEPRGEVRVRRGDPAARRLRLLARVPGRARVPRHPRAVHRRGHGRDPAQLRRHERAEGRDAGQRRLEVAPRLTRAPTPVLAPTFTSPLAGRLPPAGRSVGPAVARRAAHARRRARSSPTRVARVAGGLRALGVEPGRRGRVAVGQPRRGRACCTARAGGSARSRRRVHHQMGAADVAGVLDAVRPDARRRRPRRAARPARRSTEPWTDASSSRRCCSRRDRAARRRACCTRRRRSRTRPR